MMQMCPIFMCSLRYDAKLSKLGVYFYEIIMCATTQVSIASIMLTVDRRNMWNKSYVDVSSSSMNR
jgi:hypothetical protein